MKVARIGDPLDHGGQIITGSQDNSTNNLGVARVGDSVMCSRHGMQTIVSGSTTVLTDGLPTARVGDVCSCGAVITDGSPDRDIMDSFDSNTSFVVQDGVVAVYVERDKGSTDDEPGVDDGLAIYPPIGNRAPTASEIQRSKDNGVDPTTPPPTPTETDTTPPTNNPTPSPIGCEDITLPLNYGIQLSPNFKLSNVTTGTAISKAPVVAQHGLTEQEIVCNLKAVCVNILEPMAAQFGGSQKLLITSGFRPATARGTSQHERGMAVDVQFTDQWSGSPITQDQLWERVMWVKDNIPYDQFIIEYLGRKPWLHLSFNRTGTNRRQQLTALKNGHYQPGLSKL